jgi:hypothetical protein
LKGRRLEVERQNRRDRAAADWRSYEEACHQRATEAASAPAPPPELRELTMQQVEPLVRAIARGVNQRLAPLEEKLTAVERASGTLGLALDIGLAGVEGRLNELEGKPSLKYRGVWNASEAYTAGDFCTDKGSLFICKDTCIGVRPGTSNAWQLAVQRGRDGRDRR